MSTMVLYLTCFDRFVLYKQKQNYDAVVGDITITGNRSLYVDFTLPYTDMGVGMVTRLAPKESQKLWIFLKPLTPGLWLTMVGVYVLTALVIWLIERPAFVEQQAQQSNGRFGRMFGFSFSILVFAHCKHPPMLHSKLLRFNYGFDPSAMLMLRI